jgi:hypothetical protein
MVIFYLKRYDKGGVNLIRMVLKREATTEKKK